MTNVDFLVEHVKESIIMSDSNFSGISKEIIDMPGMSGTKTRHLYNNICNLSKDYTYFEVGTWLGSSFISANYNNQINSIACDNWASKVCDMSKKYGFDPTIEYGEPRHEVKHAYCDHNKAKKLLDFSDKTNIDNLI